MNKMPSRWNRSGSLHYYYDPSHDAGCQPWHSPKRATCLSWNYKGEVLLHWLTLGLPLDGCHRLREMLALFQLLTLLQVQHGRSPSGSRVYTTRHL